MDFHFPWAFRINILAVLAATVAYLALGFVWYGRAAFGRRWLALTGRTEEQVRGEYRPSTFLWSTLWALVTAGALAWIVSRTNSWTPWWGAKVGFIAGVGIVFTTLATDALYQPRPRPLVWINAGYHLIGMMVMGAILGAWNR